MKRNPISDRLSELASNGGAGILTGLSEFRMSYKNTLLWLYHPTIQIIIYQEGKRCVVLIYIQCLVTIKVWKAA